MRGTGTKRSLSLNVGQNSDGRADARWVQLGVCPAQDASLSRQLLGEIAATGRDALTRGVAQNFFFMRKPPGLRLRFEVNPDVGDEFADLLYEQADSWRADGLIEAVRPGVYEPETVLFGGPESMHYVHALFTVDSLFWLTYHSIATPDQPAEPTLVSLPLLRFLLDGLDITGWEDLGVWDQVRTATGRQLPAEADLTGFADVFGGIRRLWYEQSLLMEQLDPVRQALLIEHGELLRHGAQRWSNGYFASRSATLGPRAAAAYYVVFFWNRAGLSAIEQAMVAESLSVRENQT